MEGRALVLGLALTSGGCGDSLVGENFLGTPILELGGPVVQGEPRVPASHGDLSARLFWVGAPDEAEEQTAWLDGGLAAFAITLFDPPPAEATTFSDRVISGRLGLGIIVLYADRNADQRFDATQDMLLGASAQHVVVYTSDGLGSEDPAFALLGALEPGYHLFEHDQPSQCRFIAAATCSPEGALRPASDPDAVVLTLWDTPDKVRVPAPALDPSASIWGSP